MKIPKPVQKLVLAQRETALWNTILCLIKDSLKSLKLLQLFILAQQTLIMDI